MPQNESTLSSKQSIAVIGSGYWGKNLIRNLNNLGVLRLLCDKNKDLLKQFKIQYPEVDTCIALNEVLSNEHINGVFIATPAENHYIVARESLLSGKHVFVEKPLSLSDEEGEDLIHLADKKERVLMVGHLLQYHPIFKHLKELVSNGELGRINYIYSHRLNLGKIRREENILWSFAPHDISMILSLADEEPENIIATGGNYLHKKIADVTTTHLEFPSGLRAHIFVSWLHPFKDQKLVVVGDKKMAVFDDTKPWEDKLLLYPHTIKWQNNTPLPLKAEAEKIEIPQDEPLRIECKTFLKCMSNGKKPITDGREGLRVLRILNACQKSLDQNGRQVVLSETSNKKSENKGNLFKNPVISSKKLLPENPDFFIHNTAILDDNVNIETDTKIWQFSHILSGSKIGRGCNIGQNVVVGPNVTIGNGCKIQNNVSIYQGVTLEDSVFCGPSMVFTNVYNPRAQIKRMDELRSTLVKNGATLGANCTILCGVTIGQYAFIGAGSVVLKSVPDFALVAGNPARTKGWMCQCGIRLHFESEMAVCNECGLPYSIKNNRVYLHN